jgi:hypothetical protein
MHGLNLGKQFFFFGISGTEFFGEAFCLLSDLFSIRKDFDNGIFCINFILL